MPIEYWLGVATGIAIAMTWVLTLAILLGLSSRAK